MFFRPEVGFVLCGPAFSVWTRTLYLDPEDSFCLSGAAVSNTSMESTFMEVIINQK